MNVMKDLMTMCALAGAVCLVSCSNDDDNEMRVNPDGSVRFTAAIGNTAVVTNPAPQSRASATTWDAGDDISVFMVAHGTADVANGAENRRHAGRRRPALGESRQRRCGLHQGGRPHRGPQLPPLPLQAHDEMQGGRQRGRFRP